MRATICTRNFFKKPCAFPEIVIFYLFWGGFVWGLYGGGLIGKCKSFGRDLNFWPARHTPRQISQKAWGTDHLLCAFWTAGFTTRPPDIGSGRCNLIFQVSNRTIVCILKLSARMYVYWSYGKIWLTDAHRFDWKSHIKKPTFYVLTPVQFWGCFSTRLGILRSPMWFFSEKSEYWRNYKGGGNLFNSNWFHYTVVHIGHQ